MADKEQVILFDGVCNLCNSSVNFVIDRDTQQHFKFASLQSDFGQDQVQKIGDDPSQLNSIVLIEGDRFYRKSTAALRVARKLSGGWPMLYAFIIIPPFLRDLIYDFIAKNRYRWFGKEDACRIPTPELSHRFL
ncbi:MAG: thiol-disulfide oxidoreductase DCC family protein [Cytophagales bacterium]|nr:thiol-disulfide oxidoreductase DCC family protein [Cytophagales bacterium]